MTRVDMLTKEQREKLQGWCWATRGDKAFGAKECWEAVLEHLADGLNVLTITDPFGISGMYCGHEVDMLRLSIGVPEGPDLEQLP